MIATTNSTEGGTQTETYEVSLCSSSLLVGLQQQSIYFSVVNIFLSITAFLGNFLILVRCPQQGIFPPSTVQTLVSLSGNNWSVGWSFYPASRCYLLDVRSSQKLESLSIRNGRNLHIKLCIMWSVFLYVDGHKRGQTSRSVVGNKIQTKSNFKAHYVYWLRFPSV